MVALVKKDGKWVEASLTSYGKEEELKLLLKDSPDLIPGCHEAVAIVDEFQLPGRGAVDLLAVNDAGEIWLVECKLAKNDESRRKVTGQIIEYAGLLHGLDFDGFNARFAARNNGKGIVEAVAASVGPDFTEDAFRAAVTESLIAGRFRLVIAVDQIKPELERTIQYLAAVTGQEFSLIALELGLLKQGDVHVLITDSYGAELADSSSPASANNKRWSREAVGTATQDMPHGAADVVTRLFDHADAKSARFQGGSGAVPSAGIYYPLGGANRSLWSIWAVDAASADIALNLGTIASIDVALAQNLGAALEDAGLGAYLPNGDAPLSTRAQVRMPASAVAEAGAIDLILASFNTLLAEDEDSSPTGTHQPPATSLP